MIGIIKIFIKSVIAFSVSFVILSIPINGDTLFEKLSDHVKPFEKSFVNNAKEAVKVGLESTREISKQFISNTAPKVFEKKKLIHVQGNIISEDGVATSEDSKEGPSKFDRPEKYEHTDKKKLDTLFN